MLRVRNIIATIKVNIYVYYDLSQNCLCSLTLSENENNERKQWQEIIL